MRAACACLFQTDCCSGHFTTGESVTSNGNCYWKFATWGQQVRCNFDTEAVFGRCGAGADPNCIANGEYNHGIYCCTLTTG